MSLYQIKKSKNNSRYLLLDEVDDFAHKFVATLKPGDIVALTGTLGSGKTTFVNAVMRELSGGRLSEFSSPTFTILNRYTTPSFTVYHVDLYRLKKYDELFHLDILDMFGMAGTVTFIEWADKFDELKGLFTKRVHFEYVHDKTLERLIAYDGFTV